MPEEIISSFARVSNNPIETNRKIANLTVRNNIPSGVRWEGMIVYVESEEKNYFLQGGVDNSNWVDLGGVVDISVQDNLTSTSTTDALSANQGKILNDTKLNDLTAGTGIILDKTDPLNIVITSTGGGGGSVAWGAVTGTLSDQTDLQGELDDKEDAFTKNTGFNLDLGTTGGTVLEGNWRPTFAQVTSKPTTIGGYGITDFNSLGDARWLGLSGTAADSSLLDGIDSGSFLRSDVADVKTSGDLTFNTNVFQRFGTGSIKSTFGNNGTNQLLNLVSSDFQILDNSTTRITIGRSTGSLTATGPVTGSNLYGTNTGDETTGTIQTKRPIKTVNGTSLEGSGNVVISGGSGVTETIGTWTPAMYGSTSGTYSITSDEASYIRIGNVCYFNGSISSIIGTSVGDIRISGFPYDSDGTFTVNISKYTNFGGNTTNLRADISEIPGDTTAMQFYTKDDISPNNDLNDKLTITSFSGASISFSGFFFIAPTP